MRKVLMVFSMGRRVSIFPGGASLQGKATAPRLLACLACSTARLLASVYSETDRG